MEIRAANASMKYIEAIRWEVFAGVSGAIAQSGVKPTPKGAKTNVMRQR
ncbi:hypothetical protein [Thiomonas intermedia]|nr:hypothetical protein [Thiomonas intermedia]